jgi:hypothetical protein
MNALSRTIQLVLVAAVIHQVGCVLHIYTSQRTSTEDQVTCWPTGKLIKFRDGTSAAYELHIGN